MDPSTLSQELLQAVDAPPIGSGNAPQDLSEAERLIGLLQAARPDGEALWPVLEQLEHGPAFCRRLRKLYQATKTSSREDSLRDAYFVVRDPPMLQAAIAKGETERFVEQLSELASWLKIDLPTATPTVRVLEGKAPKKPRKDEDKTQFYRVLFEDIPAKTLEKLQSESIAVTLSQACYFAACDPMLRDYLLWPFVEQMPEAPRSLDPFAYYFELWRHGAKLRVVQDNQLDVYLPRRASGELIDAGQFARH